MNSNSLAHTTRQVTAGVADIADTVRDISDAVAKQCKSSYRDAGRNVRKLRVVAEEGVHDTRKRIKSHPIAALAVAASAGLFLGGLLGRITARRRRWF
ncbi:MAG TPA: hypothetical protein VIB39_17610 [Candidatus Angelobacter sp.]|jgi:ElaB/YqjD/DUF883 family membrane-anchored ribosome-binding protein